MNPQLKKKILILCSKTESVIWNNDWPTEDGRVVDYATGCGCPMIDLTNDIRKELEEL